jgi:hypothetical protein
MKIQEFSLKSNFCVFVLVLVCTIWVFSGCSSSTKRVRGAQDSILEAYEIQKPIEVRTSEEDSRPNWTKKTVFENDGKVYFSGGFLNGSDYSVTIRCANSEALKVALQGISQFIRAEFSSYVQGSNTDAEAVDRYVEDGIAMFSKNIHVQGLRQTEIYYEEMFSAALLQPSYNVWVRIEMDKADYLKAKADVLRKLRDEFAKTGQVEAKDKAEKLIEELKRESALYGT